MEEKNQILLPNPREISIGESKLVFLQIKFGNGQIGGNYLTLDEKEIGKGDFSQKRKLSNSSDLIGKTIKIRSSVLDINPYSNSAVLEITILNEAGIILSQEQNSAEIPKNGIIHLFTNYKFN